MTEDDDTPLAGRLEAQEQLYSETLGTQVTEHAIDFMIRAQLLLDIADKPETAREFVFTPAGRQAATREYDGLTIEDRDQLNRAVAGHWSLNCNLAVRKLWHACEVLGFDPQSIDPKHCALTAATLMSMTMDDMTRELAATVARETPDS